MLLISLPFTCILNLSLHNLTRVVPIEMFVARSDDILIYAVQNESNLAYCVVFAFDKSDIRRLIIWRSGIHACTTTSYLSPKFTVNLKKERIQDKLMLFSINIICYSVLYVEPFCNIGRMLSPTPVNAGRKQKLLSLRILFYIGGGYKFFLARTYGFKVTRNRS